MFFARLPPGWPAITRKNDFEDIFGRPDPDGTCANALTRLSVGALLHYAAAPSDRHSPGTDGGINPP
jgi:hypothetical protein